MNSLPVVPLPTESLRQKCRALTREELASPKIQKLIDDMIRTMRVEHGVGLAAPQIDENIQLIVLDPDGSGAQVYANPQILDQSNRTVKSEEGCLSIRGLSAVLQRSRTITVKAIDRQGNEVLLENLNGFPAIVFQHEIDHINGVLIVDRAKKIYTL